MDSAKKPRAGILARLVDKLVERYTEQRLGIHTEGFVTTESLGISRPGNHDYKPTRVRAFRAFLRQIDKPALRGVFIDYGSGMGRILTLAALHPFRKVIGIELSQTLVDIARQNLTRCQSKLVCRDVEIWCGDAASFELPDDATVLYFFNPFHGDILTGVFERIHASLVRQPRQLFVIFNNPVHFKRIAHRYPWLAPRRRFDFDFEGIVYETKQQPLHRLESSNGSTEIEAG